jgi:hypothetical protein
LVVSAIWCCFLADGAAIITEAGGGASADRSAVGTRDLGDLLTRVADLSGTVGDIEQRLRGVEVGLATANAEIDGLGSRFDDLSKRLDDLGRRMDDVTRRCDGAVTTAIGRVPSWWQMPVVIAGTVALLTALYAGGKHLRLLG